MKPLTSRLDGYTVWMLLLHDKSCTPPSLAHHMQTSCLCSANQPVMGTCAAQTCLLGVTSMEQVQ